MEKRGDKMDINVLPGEIFTAEDGLKSIRQALMEFTNEVLELGL